MAKENCAELFFLSFIFVSFNLKSPHWIVSVNGFWLFTAAVKHLLNICFFVESIHAAQHNTQPLMEQHHIWKKGFWELSDSRRKTKKKNNNKIKASNSKNTLWVTSCLKSQRPKRAGSQRKVSAGDGISAHRAPPWFFSPLLQKHVKTCRKRTAGLLLEPHPLPHIDSRDHMCTLNSHSSCTLRWSREATASRSATRCWNSMRRFARRSAAAPQGSQ